MLVDGSLVIKVLYLDGAKAAVFAQKDLIGHAWGGRGFVGEVRIVVHCVFVFYISMRL